MPSRRHPSTRQFWNSSCSASTSSATLVHRADTSSTVACWKNRPFRHAIDAIKRRPADSQVERRLLYLEPDPAQFGAEPDSPEPPPSPLATVLAAIAEILRKQPIIDDILEG